MKQDIEAIIANDPEAIIVIAGDHGPSLTKNCSILGKDDYNLSEISRLDIQDRFATFLAIRWPTKDFEKYDGSHYYCSEIRRGSRIQVGIRWGG